MWSIKAFSLCFIFVFLCSKTANSELQFCYNGLQRLSSEVQEVGNPEVLDCPYGLLFKEPVIVGAVGTNSSEFCVRETVCSQKAWECASLLQYSKAQLIVPNRPPDHWNLVTSDSKIDRTIPSCRSYPSLNSLKTDMDNVEFTEESYLKRKKRQAVALPPLEDQAKYSDSKIQAALEDQTKRLFYYLAGINAEEVNSHLRAIQLFVKASKLVHMICDSKYLHEEFIDSVEKSFMFLLKEQGLERITDVDVEDYELLRRALDLCMADPTGYVEFGGNHCPANFHVQSLTRNGVTMQFDRTDESNFAWGSHDVVVDAAWHFIDIVHGMCFATFRENLNVHHKFQVVMEQLFHDALHLRWNSVTKLKKEEEYDNILMAPVNVTMQVLDACAQGAYIGSPFLHRLSRPEKDRVGRKKRSIKVESLVESKTLENSAYCLKSESERVKLINKLKKEQC